MRREYTHALIIGRFQPLHRGHMQLITHAREIAETVVLVLGSHRTAPSLHNPWTTDERMKQIGTVAGQDLEFIALEDSAYDFADWLKRLRQAVQARCGKDSRIVLVGHSKNESTRYLDSLANGSDTWAKSLLPSQEAGLNASTVRRTFFQEKWHDLKAMVDPHLLDQLRGWLKGPVGSQLQTEFNQVEAYKARWKGSPWPPVFVTGDALLLCVGKILLIRRGSFPGKGLLALPGGYLEADESLENCILRELVEETGIEVDGQKLRTSIKLKDVFDRPDRDPRGRMITQAALIDLDNHPEPVVTAQDDAAETLWMDADRIDEFQEQFYADHALIVKYMLKKYRGDGHAN